MQVVDECGIGMQHPLVPGSDLGHLIGAIEGAEPFTNTWLIEQGGGGHQHIIEIEYVDGVWWRIGMRLMIGLMIRLGTREGGLGVMGR